MVKKSITKGLLFLILLISTNHTKAIDTVIVGIKSAPPFVIKEGDKWKGLTVNIWEHIAKSNQITTVYKEMPMDEITQQLSEGMIDVGLGAITVSASREVKFNFSNAYYPSGLGIMFQQDKSTALKIALNLISGNFIQIIFLLCLVLFGVGFFIWMAERRKNPDEFESGIKGVLSGFWWSAVTMTTVGYGDKSPKTGWGRIIGFVWMFASLIMVSYFTASIASALTVQQIGEQFNDPSDLNKVRVGAIAGTFTETYFTENRISYITAQNLEELTQMLKNGEIEAIVADYPLLKYYLNTHKKEQFKMLPHKIHEFFYAIPIGENVLLREQINQSLQQYIETEEWQDQLFNYLGETD